MNDLFLRACRRRPVERTPVWLMRQAGRSLPEYRALRERHDFPTLLREPELAAEVTLQPVDRLDVDAAILFSDILVPAAALGVEVEFRPGPVIEHPLRSSRDVAALDAADPEASVAYVFETIRILRERLAGRVPLIGFAASPFTLAAYLVEGGGSKGFEHTMALLYGDPAAAQRLLEKVAETTERYVVAQVRAGAQAIQLFDTWAGLLDRRTFREFDLPHVRRIFDRLAGMDVPRIYFALHAAHLLPEIRDCGADVVGVDWRVGLAQASRALGGGFALQGNLDPSVLLAPPATIETRVREILDDASGLAGHVFNLGHGVLPATPVEHLQALVGAVRRGR
jgi:uroporphyrinogen decarboxylase